MQRWLFLLVCVLVIAGASISSAKEHKMIPRYNKITKTWTSYPAVSIHDIQYCSPGNLHQADSLQTSNQALHWQLQASQYDGQIVVVEALVTVACAADPPNIGIIYTARGWNMLLHDTTTSNEWAGLFARASDTAQARVDNFNTPAEGDIIRITGTISEFPTSSMNSSTQLNPLPGVAVEIVSSGNPIPPPTVVPISDFYLGAYPGGKVLFSTGERWEGSLVRVENVTVNAIVNAGRGTWNMVDVAGNYLSDYDISYWWSLGSSETPPLPGAPSYATPPVGGTINYIQGSIWTASGGENPRGYRITPLFEHDVNFGVTLPGISTHRRYPVTVKSSDTVLVTVKGTRLAGGYDIGQMKLIESINNGPWTEVAMTTSDSIYSANIWDADHYPYPAGTNVRYFIKGIDTAGNSNIYASSGSPSNDTTKGFFFYNVIDRPLVISDIQTTPYANGRSPYVGAKVTLHGVVTASDSDIAATALNTGGTSAIYIQDGTGQWNGIWVVKDTVNNPAIETLALGDSIVISGGVQEQFDVTRISDSALTVVSHNKKVPAPSVITTGTFGLNGNGSPVAEPYEGSLIRVVNATVTDVYPIFSDITEYQIDDGSGPMIVRRDGINNYSNVVGDTTAGDKILRVGDLIDTLTGVGFYSFNRWKIDPRRNTDFVGVGAKFQYTQGWNIVSVGRIQAPVDPGYKVSTLFPGAITSAYAFTSTYSPRTTLAPGLGYWIKFGSAKTIRQLGQKLTTDTIAVSSGWNLVGSLGDAFTSSNVTAFPSGNHLSSFFGYNNGYQIASTLNPGFGYWVKSDSVGSIVMSSSSMAPLAGAKSPASAWNSVTITDEKGLSQTLYFTYDEKGTINVKDYEMPPAMTSLGFDARYASGRAVETYSSLDPKNAKSLPINIQSTGALTISWNIVERTVGTAFISDNQGGKILPSTEMKALGSVKNVKLGNGSLVLKIGGSPVVPESYSLSQNYPNPFNPSTRMEVGLPEAARLNVAIFNVLGQKVRTLVDDARPAGIQTLIWNGLTDAGTQVASGIYFVRMDARSVDGSNISTFSQTRKIMMLK